MQVLGDQMRRAKKNTTNPTMCIINIHKRFYVDATMIMRIHAPYNSPLAISVAHHMYYQKKGGFYYCVCVSVWGKEEERGGEHWLQNQKNKVKSENDQSS